MTKPAQLLLFLALFGFLGTAHSSSEASLRPKLVIETANQGTVILQPGPSEGKDVTIRNSYQPQNYNGFYVRVGGWGDQYYTLIQFDLDGMPSDAESAVLLLYCGDSFLPFRTGLWPPDMLLDRVTGDWSEETVDWPTRPGAINEGALAPGCRQPGWYEIDLTDIYNKWQDGTYPNYGIQLRPITYNGQWNYFYSSDYGDITVELDANGLDLGATVDIRYGEQDLSHGDTFTADGAYQYRGNIGGFSGGWLQGPEGTVLEIEQDDEYAVMTVAPEAGVPVDTTADIRYGADNDGLLDGESFAVPMGNYQYRVGACGLTGPWKGFSVAASEDLPILASEDVALVAINTDHLDVTVDVRYGQDNDGLHGGDTFCAPSPTNVQYRVGAGGFSGNWIGLSIEGDATLAVADGVQYATVVVADVPDGGDVDIRYGNGNDDLGNGSRFLSPVMQDRQWRLCVGSHCSGWLIYTVADPYLLSVTEGQAFTEIGIDLSTPMGFSGLDLYVADPTARIDIRYGASGLQHGARLELPCTDIQWRLRTEDGSLSGPWAHHSVCGDGDIVPQAGADAKELQFNFDWTSSKYAKTDVRYVRSATNCNGTGAHCERIVAPCGVDIQARPDLGTISPPWMGEPVDCTWDTWTWGLDAEVTTAH